MADAELPLSEALHRLASAHGIATYWHDVFGERQEVPASSLRSLLEAMGIPAASDDEIHDALTAAANAVWRRPLPPAHVANESALPTHVILRLPESLDVEILELQLLREDGSQDAYSITPNKLDKTDSVAIAGKPFVARKLELPRAPLGYHQVRLSCHGETLAELVFIVTPKCCYEPAAVRSGGRVWGPTIQLYGLRSQRNWGIGDFSDLQAALSLWTRAGAGLVGVNPLHALFPHNPTHTSPYSPSNRLFLNVLYIDPERVEDLADCEAARTIVRSAEFQTKLAELRSADLVSYEAVAEVKLRVLEQLYACFRRAQLDPGTRRGKSFRSFQRRGGRALELHATFEALQETLSRKDSHLWGWPVWPEEFRDPDSPDIAQFRERNAERVEFYQYLQWQADLQLGAVGALSFELGTGVGLYGDLAVSMDPGGSESWSQQKLLATGVSVGAPPDELNPTGQSWGLPPYVPGRLAEAGFTPFIALLRATMRHNGALRIDHVMGLERLYWVPSGEVASAGAYVCYPLEDLLGIVALESQRNSCLVIGEDLGTVSDRMRAALAERGVLSYRVLLFERRQDGGFKAPSEFPANALAAAATHDLPTLVGFWEGRDLTVRGELGQFPNDEVRQRLIVGRAEARAQLLFALEREGLLPEGMGVDTMSAPSMTPELILAIHEYLARSSAKLLAVQSEDVLGLPDQFNLPGTTGDTYPNWRRKLSVDLETLTFDERFAKLSARLSQTRPVAESSRPRISRRSQRAVIPRATYRVQLNSTFTFADVTKHVPYLASLGVSHVYCSPYFRARPGSMHGYDVVDHNTLNPEIGTREDFERFVETLRTNGMGHILDIVPNHVGIMGADNSRWMDVLENGQASVYAQFFDIDWQPANPLLLGKVLVPVLGDRYGRILERGEIELQFECRSGSLSLFYHEHRFPLDPHDYPRILERALAIAPRDRISDDERAELESLTASFGHLPDRRNSSSEAINERNRDKELHKRRLAELCARNSALSEAISAATRIFMGREGASASFDALHDLLESQAYRLAYWRVASDEINYRRFFDVNDLAALRMENDAVFEATHRNVLDLLAEGKIDGLRIDHPDGLYHPAQYFRRLQQRAGAASFTSLNGNDDLPLYLLIEKITASFEKLPLDWPVHGTTGYHFANVVNGLFVDGGSKLRFDRLYRAFIGEHMEWPNVVFDAKLFIVRTSLAAELSVLANHLVRIARAERDTRDFTLNSLRQALAEVIACFPVYRTYVAETVSNEDRRYIDWGLASAKRRSAAIELAVFDFVRDVLLGEGTAANPAIREAARAFAMKFQQVTSPVTAKGVEDTAHYRFNRLVSLNEVGGEPDTFGTSVRAFHADSSYRARYWPHEMLGTSTHDTKRSEDVRARINVLSEMVNDWKEALDRWSRMNRSRKRAVEDSPAPSANDEYLLYQTLIGTLPLEDAPDEWPQYIERIEAYMIKAAREAKLNSSWSNVNEEYEEALKQFVRGILDRREGNLFLSDLVPTVQRISRFGLLNSLSQTLCKLTAPGVPDIYQGNELWDFSLVDPDNRRPVDYDKRREWLEQIKATAGAPFPSSANSAAGNDTEAERSSTQIARFARSLLDSLSDGRAKLFVTCQVLQLRREREDLFRHGDYLPLRVTGDHANRLCAYARRRGQNVAITLAPRLFRRLVAGRDVLPLGPEIWADTAVELPRGLADSPLTNLFDGATAQIVNHDGRSTLKVADALLHFPVALLAT